MISSSSFPSVLISVLILRGCPIHVIGPSAAHFSAFALGVMRNEGFSHSRPILLPSLHLASRGQAVPPQHVDEACCFPSILIALYPCIHGGHIRMGWHLRAIFVICLSEIQLMIMYLPRIRHRSPSA
jgi:hypothetical protein